VKPTVLVLAALLSLSLTACGGDDEPPREKDPSSTPTLPVAVGTVQGALVTHDMSGEATVPLPGKLTIKGPGGSSLTADITEDGRYAIQLAPGDYTITATSPQYVGTCHTDPRVTTLVADETVETDVICPEG